MTKIVESISRVRNSMKIVNDDAFITDRYIYSLIVKYGKTLVYRDSKKLNILNNPIMFKEIPCFRLKEIDVVDNCCIGINTGCKVMVSVEPLPEITSIDNGPVIKAVTTIDGSKTLIRTTKEQYYQMKKSTSFKYNTNKYYWIENNHIYVPDVMWESVRISAMFNEDINDLLCPNSNLGDNSKCKYFQDGELQIPEYLLSEAEQMTLQEMMLSIKVQPDIQDDNQHIMRS